ncbi:MAG: hypothetical protein WA971_16215, partial [Microbacterium sp.]
VLRRLAAGGSSGGAELRELPVVEGGVRDLIRARGLRHPLLDDRVAALRRVGAQVLLLDDSTDGARISDAAVERLLDLLSAPGIESATIRITGREVGIVVESGGVPVRRERWDLARPAAADQGVNGQISGTQNTATAKNSAKNGIPNLA